MNLIDDEDLVPIARGRYRNRVYDDITHIIDAGVRRSIDLEHIHRSRSYNFLTRVAFVAGLGGHTTDAVQRLCKNASGGGFADAASARENIGVMDAVVFQRVTKRSGNRVLTNDLIEGLRSELAG